MAILKVAQLGHPVLRQVAAPVPLDEISSQPIQQLIDNMIDTNAEYDGAGLAAPQVHVSKRVFIAEVRGNPRYPEAESVPLTVIINPVVTLGEETEFDWEGCLSLGDLRGIVERSLEVTVEGYDRSGDPLKITTDRFFAKVIQHETDHLNGIVFPDRMENLTSLAFQTEQFRYHSVYEKALKAEFDESDQDE